MKLFRNTVIALSMLVPAAKAHSQEIVKDTTKVVSKMVAEPQAAVDSKTITLAAKDFFGIPTHTYGVNYYTATRIPANSIGVYKQTNYNEVTTGIEAIVGADNKNKDLLLKGVIKKNILDIEDGVHMDFVARGHGQLGKHYGANYGALGGEVAADVVCKKNYKNGMRLQTNTGIGLGMNMPHMHGDFTDAEVRMTPRFQLSLGAKNVDGVVGCGVDTQAGTYANVGVKYTIK